MLRETTIQITYILLIEKKNTILLLKYLTFKNEYMSKEYLGLLQVLNCCILN